jgi:hypothetical protein
LTTLYTNLNKYFADEIEKHLAKDEVLELQKREPKYKEFLAVIKRLEYLGSLSAKNLWTHFRTSILEMSADFQLGKQACYKRKGFGLN